VTQRKPNASARALSRKKTRMVGQAAHRFVRDHRLLKAPLGWISMRVGLAPADSLLRRLLGSSRAFIRGDLEASEVNRVLSAFEAGRLRYWLAGGWGVDALIGVQSRAHDDLDIVLERFEQMEPVARRLMAALGYSFVDSHRDDAFTLPLTSTFDDGEGHRVQLVSLAWRWLAAELGLPAPDESDEAIPAALVEAVSAEGAVEGRRVPCVSVRTQRFLHADHPSAHAPSGKKHRGDMDALQRAYPEPRSGRAP
jgi:lincosamide nucleotidyltransferase A/C/D/E